MASDAELWAAWRGGDDNAIADLLSRYEVSIYNYLYRMLHDHHAAEDATQEAFVNVIRASDRYTEQGHFKRWLFQIAHRKGLHKLRTTRRISSREKLSDLQEETIPDTTRSPAQDLAGKEQLRNVERAIEALPTAEKEVFMLRTFSGLRFRDIAKVMECPINTALGRMRNACARLRQNLQEPGDE